MAQQQPQELNVRVRMAVLVFCKDMSSPMVLYFENAQKIYDDLRKLISQKTDEVKMVEFEPIGPIKHASIMSDRIVGVALQEERYIIQQEPQQ